jgi:four helix bundle protein
MSPDELKLRTQDFTVVVVGLCKGLPLSIEGRTIAAQLIRCSASVAANYRAVCRARSRREFVAKMGIVLEEADEAQFWLELIVKLGLLVPDKVKSALNEATELVAIFTASRRTAQRHLMSSRSR